MAPIRSLYGFVPVTLDPAVCATRWLWTAPATQMSTITTAAGRLYVSAGHVTYALNEFDHSVAWRHDFNVDLAGYNFNTALNPSSLTNAVPCSATKLNQVVELNGKLLAFANNDTNEKTPEGWSSSDDATWTQLVANAPYSPRAGYRVVVHNNLVYVIDGVTSFSSALVANERKCPPIAGQR